MDTSRVRPPYVPGRWTASRLWHRLERAFPSWAPLDWRSYSNQGEDRVLLDLLHGHAPPFYVDVGAHHPVAGSDTYLLYRNGWRGVAVEADPRWRRAWRRRRPRDRYAGVAVDVRPGRRTFFLQGESSTLLKAWARPSVPSVEVDCTTLDALLEDQAPGQAIGLLKIDIEGLDVDVLESLDLGRWRPCTVLVETHHWTTADAVADRRLAAWAKRGGYEVVAHNRRNVLLADAGWLRGRFAAVAPAYEALNPSAYRRAR